MSDLTVLFSGTFLSLTGVLYSVVIGYLCPRPLSFLQGSESKMEDFIEGVGKQVGKRREVEVVVLQVPR